MSSPNAEVTALHVLSNNSTLLTHLMALRGTVASQSDQILALYAENNAEAQQDKSARNLAHYNDKGINFPDSHIQLPPLIEKDLNNLDFVCQYADLVGYSFVQSRSDMELLIHELERRHAYHLGIIAKIETKTAVKNLPEIMLSTIPNYRLGVMIARGDLAVELGGERMAEIQEELLAV